MTGSRPLAGDEDDPYRSRLASGQTLWHTFFWWLCPGTRKPFRMSLSPTSSLFQTGPGPVQLQWLEGLLLRHIQRLAPSPPSSLCHVVDTSAHRLLSYGRVGALHHAPKVSNHQCLAIFLQEKKIVRLDVPVDNLLSVEILQPANQLLQVIRSRSLVASSPGLFLDELRHIPSKGIVQDHEDPCGIVEIPVAFEYIFVIEG